MLVTKFIVTTILIQFNDAPPLHPLSAGNAPPIKYSDIGLGCSSFYGKIQSSIFFHEKEISTCRGQYLLLLTYNSLVKHQSDKLKVIMVIMIYYLS